MTDPAQFGSNKPSGKSPAGPFDCATAESWLAESAEKSLSPEIAEQIRIHVADCPSCNEKLTEALRGREWLLVLKQETLEPPADLVSKILARTSLAKDSSDRGIAPSKALETRETVGQNRATFPASIHKDFETDVPSADVFLGQVSKERSTSTGTGPMVVLRRTILEPRFALVAAMAFFSISLTLNLLGIRLGGLRGSDLTPNGMRRTITRQYADANARVVRYYENLRVVYEVEARVQHIRRESESTLPAEPEKKPRKQSLNDPDSQRGNGSTHLNGTANYQTIEEKQQASLPDSNPTAVGPEIDAELQSSPWLPRARSLFGRKQERQLA